LLLIGSQLAALVKGQLDVEKVGQRLTKTGGAWSWTGANLPTRAF
jgi:hypothetical protein